MRIRRSVSRFFAGLILPMLSIGVTLYFASYAIWGERGVVALGDTKAKLAIQQEKLAEMQEARTRLEHRITLLEPGAVDPDLVEELARGQLLDGGPNQVALPRNAP